MPVSQSVLLNRKARDYEGSAAALKAKFVCSLPSMSAARHGAGALHVKKRGQQKKARRSGGHARLVPLGAGRVAGSAERRAAQAAGRMRSVHGDV